MKKVGLVILVLLVVIVFFVLSIRNTIIKNVLEKGTKEMVGQKITIGDVSAGIMETKIKFDRLEVYNPAGYTDKFLADIHELYINYALLDILKGFIHLPELKIDIKEMNVEKDKGGILNLEHFKSKKEEATSKKGKQKFLVNKMKLEIDTIRYRDNTKTPQELKEFQIDFKQDFVDVDSADTIINEIKNAVINQLIQKGIRVTLQNIIQDQKLQKALMEGDTKTIEEQGVKDLGNIGKGILGDK